MRYYGDHNDMHNPVPDCNLTTTISSQELENLLDSRFDLNNEYDIEDIMTVIIKKVGYNNILNCVAKSLK